MIDIIEINLSITHTSVFYYGHFSSYEILGELRKRNPSEQECLGTHTCMHTHTYMHLKRLSGISVHYMCYEIHPYKSSVIMFCLISDKTPLSPLYNNTGYAPLSVRFHKLTSGLFKGKYHIY